MRQFLKRAFGLTVEQQRRIDWKKEANAIVQAVVDAESAPISPLHITSTFNQMAAIAEKGLRRDDIRSAVREISPILSDNANLRAVFERQMTERRRILSIKLGAEDAEFKDIPKQS